jgi:hypothetical protein
MALNPTKRVHKVVKVPAEWDEGAEQIDSISTTNDYYTQSGQEDEILIDSERVVTNRYGTEISKDIEHWIYEVYKGPPLERTTERYANVYLPGIGGRILRKVEEEEVEYWAFTPYADGDNLAKTRMVSGFVVYDTRIVEAELTAEERANIEADGRKVPTRLEVVLDSGRMWSEANLKSNIVPEADSNQIAKWKKHIIVEHDIVDEEPDRWIIWTLRKNGLRGGQVEVIGPKEIRKTGFAYRLPYPMSPPELKAEARSDSIYLEAEGGGAEVTNRWFPANQFSIAPTHYKFYRKKISEPERSPVDDPYGWWKTPPTAADRTQVIEDTATTDLDGAPSTSLPGQDSYVEPHDPTPEPLPEETAFKLIATVENAHDRDTDKGFASYVDQDVVSGAEYEYYATAVINDDESTDSNHERVTYDGAHNRYAKMGRRVAEDGSVEIDALAPEDPGVLSGDPSSNSSGDPSGDPGVDLNGDLLDAAVGETVIMEIPTQDDAETVANEVSTRLFDSQAGEDITIDLEILIPMLGLEYGQGVKVPEVVWQTIANSLIVTTQTIGDTYRLRGFSRDIKRDDAGSWTSQKTTLHLERRSS